MSKEKRILAQAKHVLECADAGSASAEDEYLTLIDMLDEDENAACRLIVRLSLEREKDWSDELIDRVAGFAYQRCYEVGIDPLWVVLETVGFAVEMRTGGPVE